MGNNKTRRNKNKSGGGNCNKNSMMGGNEKSTKMNKKMTDGGKRKTRKASKGSSKGPSNWTSKVMEIYHKMKKTNPATKLGDAMKHASALKKKGQL